MTDNAVDIKDLTQSFAGMDAPALEQLTLGIARGKITGIIGPDGAGKSTLLRLIGGLMAPTSGSVRTLGLDPLKDKSLLTPKLGYMPQKFGLYEDLTVIENLRLYADLKGLSPSEASEAFARLLKFTGLDLFQTRLAGRLSGGMKQKLGLACALLGTPQLLILDEPSVGVDPLSRRELLQMITKLKGDGATVLWSTAYLDEASHFDDCLLLDHGKVLYQGTPQKLTDHLKGRVFLLQSAEETPRQLQKRLWEQQAAQITDSVIQGDSLRLVAARPQLEAAKAVITPTEPRFEDAVIDVLGGFKSGISPLAESFSAVKSPIPYPVEAVDLVKKYGSFYAVKKNSFQIRPGEIFGLLGPNGAGKSTSFKMLCGLTRPTSGTARIMGIDVGKKPEKARSCLGYMAQKFSLYSGLTLLQNLHFFSGIYGLSGSKREERLEQIIAMFSFTPYLHVNAGELPLGYKQRLALSCAVMHNPAVLFLDEPTSGVDPLTRREFWNHINALAAKGVTVLVTTHFMDEAEYCDRISLFYNGETIATGTPDELKKSVSPRASMEETFIRLIEQSSSREAA